MNLTRSSIRLCMGMVAFTFAALCAGAVQAGEVEANMITKGTCVGWESKHGISVTPGEDSLKGENKSSYDATITFYHKDGTKTETLVPAGSTYGPIEVPDTVKRITVKRAAPETKCLEYSLSPTLPTISGWGLLILLLVMAAGLTLRVGRRQAA